MNAEVKLREVPSQRVLCIRFTTDMTHIIPAMCLAYDEIDEVIDSARGVRRGNRFALYRDKAFSPDCIDVEVAIDVDREVAAFGRVHYRVLAGGLMASVTHRGPYETMCRSCAPMLAWIERNGYRAQRPFRDVYFNDSRYVAPEDIMTEILCPVVKVKHEVYAIA